GEKTPLWICIFAFITAFILAGFSEPPTATAVTALFLVIGIIFYFSKSLVWKNSLALLIWVFAGALIGLTVMILSPANANVAQERGVNIVEILSNSFFYSYLFIIDSLKTQPLPIVISILIPLTLVWLYKHANLSSSEIPD